MVNNSCSLGSQKGFEMLLEKKKKGGKLSRGVCGFGKRGICMLHTNATLTMCPVQQILLQIM